MLLLCNVQNAQRAGAAVAGNDTAGTSDQNFLEMIHFFKVYKELENKATAVDEIENAESAKAIIASDIEHYIDTFCK